MIRWWFIILIVNIYLEYKILYKLGKIYRFMTDFISIYITQIIFNKKIDLILIGIINYMLFNLFWNNSI